MLSLSRLGQAVVEYALLLVLVTIVAFTVLSVLGAAIGNIFSNIVANL